MAKKEDEVKMVLTKKGYKTTCTVLGILSKIVEVVAIIGAITCGVCGVILGLGYQSINLNDAVEIITSDADLRAQLPISIDDGKQWIDGFLAKGQGEQLAVILGGIALVAIMLAIISMLAHHVSKFFKNLARNRSPFSMDNIDRLQKIGIWIFVVVGYSILVEIITPLILGVSNVTISVSLDLIGVGFGALVLAVVFKRGYDLENKTKV